MGRAANNSKGIIASLSQKPIRPWASWAIDSQPIRARGIIVK